MKNESVIRKWWDENREYQKDLLSAEDFKYQDGQAAIKSWMDSDFNREKLKKISEIENARHYRNDGHSEKDNKNFYDEIGFSDEERKFVDDVCTKIQRGPIELRLDGNTIPIICSMAKYKLGNIDDNGIKKRFDFLLNPEKKIPITPNNLKKISQKLGLDENINDEELIKKIDGLNLPDCKCVNSLNQSLLYMRILFDAFKEKNDKNGGNESEKNQIGEEKEVVNEYVKLLINNHNIILHGAPGTGKTYLAKEIAKKMIFGDSFDTEKDLTTEEQTQFNEQCGFVQFHQSYDYTDFVEGLRPKDDGKGNIVFERKDGVFKEFCKKAIGAHFANFEPAYKKFIEDLNENNGIKLQTLKQKKSFSVRVNSNGNLYATPDTKAATDMPVTKELLKVYVETGEIKDWKPYVTAIGEYLKENYSLGDLSIDDSQKEKKYIFIIDEINRGEMSKIFGELFYSIDPGYRGIKGRIKTQYQNLIDDKHDVFVDGFYVPENIYIIGTMNDIDRSVESMDFAMRRRFAFKEVTAKQSKTMLDKPDSWKNGNGEKIDVSPCLENIKNRMDNLNNAILNKEFNLGQAYQIGGAYFLKFANYCETNGNKVEGEQKKAFDSLWKNHLEGVLREYLRGMDNVEGEDGKLKKLEKAYNLDVKYKVDGMIEENAKNENQSVEGEAGGENGGVQG